MPLSRELVRGVNNAVGRGGAAVVRRVNNAVGRRVSFVVTGGGRRSISYMGRTTRVKDAIMFLQIIGRCFFNSCSTVICGRFSFLYPFRSSSSETMKNVVFQFQYVIDDFHQ